MSPINWNEGNVAELIWRDRRRVLRQSIPLTLAAALMALWLSRTEPVASAGFVGMFIAWAWSVVWAWRTVRRHWLQFVKAQPVDAEVAIDHTGVSWKASYGSRTLRWDGITVRRMNGIWLFEVAGREVAYLPAHGLEAQEEQELEKRLRDRA